MKRYKVYENVYGQWRIFDNVKDDLVNSYGDALFFDTEEDAYDYIVENELL